MSLVFSAIVPHPPILIPNIGKDNIEKISKTKESFAQLERDLYAAKPDIVIFISPHGQISSDGFTVNLRDSYEASFESFGDFGTKLKLKGDTVLMTMGLENINNKIQINIISEEKLDHGIGVPAYCLLQHFENIKIIPIYFSLFDNQTHLEFGKSLKELIMSSDKRIAVIASGDLSHCLIKSSPAGYNSSGKEFDEKLIKLLENKEAQSIVNLDHNLIENAHECGLRSIIILLGILNNVNYETNILSYEAPFGVGYLTANLKIL